MGLEHRLNSRKSKQPIPASYFKKIQDLAHRGPIYQIIANENHLLEKSRSFDKYIRLGRPLNLDIFPNFFQNFGK